MGYKENLKKLLDQKMPCEHTLREVLKTKDFAIRYCGDIPVLLCPKCGVAYPLWEVRIRITDEPSTSDKMMSRR